MKISLSVKGMHCKSCKMLVEEELEDLGATDIKIVMNEDTQTGQVQCEYPSEEKVVAAIKDLGEYKVTRS